MVDINPRLVGSVDAIDMILGSVAKPLVERTVSPVTGNGNFISGALKIGGAVMVAKYAGNNRFGKALAIGAGMDGAEDMIVAFTSRAGLGTGEQTQAGVF